MQLNRFFFIFYRFIEKFTSVRLESYILYTLFHFYYIVFFRRIINSNKINDFDKRELWEKFRFSNISRLSEFKTTLEKCLIQGPINFENAMEISIRGHHILQGKLIHNSKVKAFLYFTFFANLLCPDIYIKRDGLKLRDRSNNHQFYVLFYNFKFLKKFFSIDSSRKLLKFVEVRIKNGILNEGSTFYHLGVIGCVNDLIKDNFISMETLRNYPKLKECIEDFDSHYKLLSNVNFGDRDETFLSQIKETKELELSDKPSFIESIHIQALSDDFLIFINKIKDDEFGTGGHFHDDYGHFVLQKKHKSIVYDLGTYKYKFEPMYCRREFHNLPFFTDTPGVEYKGRFIRSKNIKLFTEQTSITLCLLMNMAINLFEDIFYSKQKE